MRHIDIRFHDGGRSASSHPNEARDCTVRATALFLDRSYDEIHEFYRQYGRDDRHRAYNTEKTLAALGITIKHAWDYGRPTVGQFVKRNPKGTFLICIRGHVFTVKDGVAWDMSRIGKRTYIEYFCERG